MIVISSQLSVISYQLKAEAQRRRSRIDQFIGRRQLNSRAESDWSQIRLDLGALANIFGFNNVNGGGYNGGNRGNVEPWRRLP
ncbi:MAG TPA: hypothetical protein VGN95_12980 [Pyrinomonadaceae bacterium]|nr:hypothetical protein [Pyrinomonadaceae bacterium]